MPIEAQPVAPAGFASYGLAAGIIPVGATTFTLTFGPYTDALGVNIPDTLTGKLFPVDQTTGRRVKVVHLPTGQAILPADVPITVTGGSATVGPLPNTGQSSMTPFFYRVEWNVASNKPSPGNKTFAVTSGTTVDYDLLTVATPASAVNTADQAIATLLNDPTSATYAKVVALIAARAGFGNGTP